MRTLLLDFDRLVRIDGPSSFSRTFAERVEQVE